MHPFHFKTKLDQTLLLGRRARNIDELLRGVREVPDASIYYHTHRFLAQHQYLSPEPPNDFAYWSAHILGDPLLGERLWSVDIVRFHSIRELRERFLDILEIHLASAERKAECGAGEEFYFMATRTFVLPTRHTATTLREFGEILGKVSIASIYFHVFDAKLRLKNDENDFSRWFGDGGYARLAAECRRLDPYSRTLDGLRQEIIELVKKHGNA